MIGICIGKQKRLENQIEALASADCPWTLESRSCVAARCHTDKIRSATGFGKRENSVENGLSLATEILKPL